MATAKYRKTFLDLLRIIACFLVIVNHTNSDIFFSKTPESITWFASLTYFFISKMAVPIFFMISGYLFLNKIDSYKKCFERIIRVVVVLIGCGFVYAVYNTYYVDPEPSLINCIKRFVSVYNTTPSNALWYLYAYLGILVMLPFIQKMVSIMTKRDFHVFFAISGFCFSVLPIINHYFPAVSMHYCFELPLFGQYICMLLIGQYFSRFGIKKTKRSFCIAAALFVSMVAFNVVATYFEYQKSSFDYLFLDNCVFFPILLQSACAFYMASFVELPEKIAKVVSYVGACTFGIYLISDISIVLLHPIYVFADSFLPRVFAVVVFEICVFIIGLIIVSILKKIPIIKKVL